MAWCLIKLRDSFAFTCPCCNILTWTLFPNYRNVYWRLTVDPHLLLLHLEPRSYCSWQWHEPGIPTAAGQHWSYFHLHLLKNLIHSQTLSAQPAIVRNMNKKHFNVKNSSYEVTTDSGQWVEHDCGRGAFRYLRTQGIRMVFSARNRGKHFFWKNKLELCRQTQKCKMGKDSQFILLTTNFLILQWGKSWVRNEALNLCLCAAWLGLFHTSQGSELWVLKNGGMMMKRGKLKKLGETSVVSSQYLITWNTEWPINCI